MGDHRASIKIEFVFHGETYKQEWWINWSPDSDSGVDHRIIEWFRDCADNGMAKYNARMQEMYLAQHQAAIEADERAMMERLQKKYPNSEKPDTKGKS